MRARAGEVRVSMRCLSRWAGRVRWGAGLAVNGRAGRPGWGGAAASRKDVRFYSLRTGHAGRCGARKPRFTRIPRTGPRRRCAWMGALAPSRQGEGLPIPTREDARPVAWPDHLGVVRFWERKMTRIALVPALRKFAVGSAAALLFLPLPGTARAAAGTVADESLQAWKAFRAGQPFQTQQILLSTERNPLSRTLIFTEPPPRLTLERVTAILSRDLVGCGVQPWSVMSGGSVADIVCTLKGGASASLPDALARLQLEAFGSTEFAPVVALPAPRRAMSKSSLDLRFSAADLHRWLMVETASFRSGPLSAPVSLQDLLQGDARGVFSSTDSRLVVWAVDRSSSIDGSSAEIRKFGVRSDLVLGAVASRRTVLIVGRGRIESVAHLPPLRSETVLLLAGSDQQHLAQSYERNDLLAGKSGDGNDRAPILLSPQLVDTEFGTLLNVADQLLKGWSMAGQTRYVKFGYPAPRSYPFGDKPAAYVEKDRSSFLFNWNTDGAAYRQQIDGLDVVVPQRTGSLSVIYGDPKDRPRGMEETAYDYFSSSGDVTLARVVQYTLLYQIFRQFDLKAARPAVSARFARFTSDIDDVTRIEFRTILRDMPAAEVVQAMRTYWTAYVARLPASRMAEIGRSRDELLASLMAEKLQDVALLRKAERESGGKVSVALAEWASDMRLRQAPTEAQEQRRRQAVATLRTYMKVDDLDRLLADGGRGLRRTGMLQAALDKTAGWSRIGGTSLDPGSWNHTAYVVESRGAGDVTGGHNLDAPMIRFADSPTVAKGQVSVTQEADGTISVLNNPGDTNRLRAIARDVGTRKAMAKGQLEAEVGAALRDTKAEPPVSLQAIRAVAGRAPEFSPLSAGESAYRIRSLAQSERDVLEPLVSSNQQAIVMEQTSNGAFILSRTGSPEAVEISSMTAATDALANAMIQNAGARGPVSVFVRGMDAEKAEAILTFAQSNIARYPKHTVDHVLTFGDAKSLLQERPALLNADVAHNGLRVDTQGIKVTRIASGFYEGYSRVEVPLVSVAKTPWYFRLVFYVRDIGAAGIAKLTSKLDVLLAGLPLNTSPARVQALVRSQILADMKELNIDAVLLRMDSEATNKVHDVIIGECEVERLAGA
ncbi:MAG: hypothetical protein ABJD97_06280 [Betaproteobacteria bacterium]